MVNFELGKEIKKDVFRLVMNKTKTCHMNFVIDLAHRGVSVAQW